MSWLIKALVALFVLLAMLLLPGTPDGPMLSAAASVGDELDTLIAALPETTLAAVELRGVSRRWKEIKEIPALLSAFDRLLADAGLTADDLPGLVGDAAVVAWVPGDRPGSVAPVLLLPVDRPQPVVGSLASVRARGALFVSRQQDAELLPRVSRGDGTSMIDRLPEIRLGQAGGDRALVHGRIDPQAVRELLRQRPSGTEPWIVTAALSMIDAELATVRGAEFRRDLRAGALVTEAIVRLDGRGLPAQVAAVFDSARPAAPLPHPLPADVVLASSFDPQPQACLAWMRHVARRDPRGPWRNLEFWIDELEQQAGFDLEDDLLRSLGDRGWLFVFESGAVLILEARNPELVEQALLAAREVFKEHTIGRTLGFTIPRDDDRRLGSERAHGIEFRTPFGTMPGPTFMRSGRHLLIGSSVEILGEGRALLPRLDSPETTVGTGSPGEHRPHESIRVQGPALARLVTALLDLGESHTDVPLTRAIEALATGLDEAQIGVWYEQPATIRLRAEARFADRIDTSRTTSRDRE